MTSYRSNHITQNLVQSNMYSYRYNHTAQDVLQFTPSIPGAVTDYWIISWYLYWHNIKYWCLLCNHIGGTPLHAACIHLRPQCVQMLLSHGADTELRNNNGDTPKMMAEKSDCDDEEKEKIKQEVLRLLTQHVTGRSQTNTFLLYCYI